METTEYKKLPPRPKMGERKNNRRRCSREAFREHCQDQGVQIRKADGIWFRIQRALARHGKDKVRYDWVTAAAYYQEIAQILSENSLHPGTGFLRDRVIWWTLDCYVKHYRVQTGNLHGYNLPKIPKEKAGGVLKLFGVHPRKIKYHTSYALSDSFMGYSLIDALTKLKKKK